ncbi:MAG: hypothetical protein LBT35_00150 [Tannerella sp.]|jgi:putative ABC transport system permease protein|nr:hypothetical protein [Tannerella sp.]
MEWNAMLTESTAKRFYGNENPVGKVFYFHNQNTPITVVAVCEDFPKNCSLENGVYLNQNEDSPYNSSYYSYFEIVPGGKDKIMNKLKAEMLEKAETLEPKEKNRGIQFDFIALPDIHLKFPYLLITNFSMESW